MGKSFFKVLLLTQNIAQKVMGIGLVGLDVQDLLVEGSGVLELALLVHGKGLLEEGVGLVHGSLSIKR